MRFASHLSLALLLAAFVSPAAAQLQLPRNSDNKWNVPFKGRVKFDQRFERVLRIAVDPEVMPFDSTTLTTVLNSPAVAGAAAKDTFNLSMDEYSTYVRVKAEASEKLGYIIAKVEFTMRADGRVPVPAVNAYVDSLRGHLQVTLEKTINLDRKGIEKRQDMLLNRKTYLEKKYVEVWSNRVKIAEDAGLAERSIEGKRTVIGDLDEKLMDVEVELALRETRMNHVKQELNTLNTADTLKTDPLAEELEKLVRVRARQLEGANNPGTDEDDRDAAEARMLDAKLRWIERVQELETLRPEERLKSLQKDMDELNTRREVYQRQLAMNVDIARGFYRYTEHIELLKKKEILLDKAIERIDEQVDELANYSEKLGTITVSIIGQSEEEDAAKK
ncbi:MAG: hypothetical protein WD768_04425 [Phycisphaeraceae bacterium]